MNFSIPDLSEFSYTSEYDFSSLNIHKKISKWILSSIFNKGDSFLSQELLDTLTASPFNNSIVLEEHYTKFLEDNKALFSCVLFALLMLFGLPLIGILWCLCSTCKSSSRAEREVRSCSILLSGLSLVFLIALSVFGLQFVFTSDLSLQNWSLSCSNNVNSVFHDVNLFVNNSEKQILHLTQNNFDELKNELNSAIHETTVDFENIVLNSQKEIQFKNISTIVLTLCKVVVNYIESDQLIFKNEISNLNSQLKEIQKNAKDLKSLVNICCSENPGATNTQVFYDLVKDIPPFSIPFDDISSDAYKNLESLQNSILESDNTMKNIFSSFEDKYSQELIDQINELQNDLHNETDKIIDVLEKAKINKPGILNDIETSIQQNGPLTLNLFIALIFLFLMIPLLFYGIGFLCGTLKEKEKKNLGSQILCAGNSLFFLGSGLLWLLTLLCFLVGGFGNQLVCDTLENPQSSQILQYLSKEISNVFPHSHESWNISAMILQCKDNETLYQILDLKSLYDVNELSDWQTKYSLLNTYSTIQNKLNELFDELLLKITLSSSQESEMKNMKIILNVITYYLHNYLESLTKLNLSSKLTLVENSQFSDTDISNLIKKLRQGVDDVTETIESISNHVTTFNSSPLTELVTLGDSIDKVILLLKEAKIYIHNTFRINIQKALDEKFKGFIAIIDEFIDFIINYVTKMMGFCEPLYGVIGGISKSLCEKLLTELNMLWIGMAVTLLAFLPLLLISIYLRRIYSQCLPSKSSNAVPSSVYWENAPGPPHVTSVKEEEIEMK